MIKKGRIAVIVVMAAIMLTAGVTTAFAASDTTEKSSGGWWSSFWSILTDDQKAQLADEADENLEQALTDGKISQEQYDKGKEAIENGEMPFFGAFGRGNRGGMTWDQKASMEEMQSRWDALTDAQKEEIYGLYDQRDTPGYAGGFLLFAREVFVCQENPSVRAVTRAVRR